MVVKMENVAVITKTANQPLWLSNFVNVYQTLSTTNLGLLTTIYHEDIVFIDPMHQVEGLVQLQCYFANLYQNLSTCHFSIEKVLLENDSAALYWQMSYQHPKLNKGNTVTVDGHSHIRGIQDKVIYHRDYLDLGAMLYEQLPLFGKLTKWIKTKAAK